ncbi:multiple epidermal growth factor-like domains protein 10 [Mercenaria mercenaria]|uniref:multiple epidermal growth factor-like domains protein 10 n=1 Tax=Mercenaria mercenaria TaxID=6596 RepID=UPI00234EBAE1|nr:multiple epidermal growth factor-like domains protein 10 [Mercenaria mercenaria]
MWSEMLMQQSVYAVIDPKCTMNCTCCKDQICGPGPFYAEGSCKKGCIDGYRGARCYEKCTFNCKRCANSTDRCSVCYNGYYPGPMYDCTSKCSPGCETCSSESVCTKCKDYNHNADNSTDCPYTYCTHKCKCQKTKCMSCIDGYYDKTTSCSKSCPDNCVSCSSEETCDKCKNGYFNGYAFDNTSLPRLDNCSHECRAHCTHCTSYDTCLKCVPGRYGLICNETCSAGCNSTDCLIRSGQCTCAPNFVGNDCKDCKVGKFGNMCEKNCSSGCKSGICNKQSGYCLKGCIIDSIVGKTCNACSVGKYGEYCNTSFPKNCNDNECDREKGTCLKCQENYTGELCQKCEKGKHGGRCNLLCPDRCEGTVCKQDSGKCFSCSGNFIGDRCAICKRGFFGSQCNDKCSEYCFDDICDRNTGVCMQGCKRHFSGDKCCLRSSNCVKCLTNDRCEECKIGFHGSTCNMTCSKYCVDNVCTLATGVCTKGCNGTFDEYLCPLEAVTEADKPEGSNQAIVAVMGVVLAISVVVNITVGTVVIVRKVQSGRRANKDGMEVAFKNNATAMSDHVDLTIHNANGMADENNTEYYNINEENEKNMSHVNPRLEKLESENLALRARVASLELKANVAEQYSRRN